MGVDIQRLAQRFIDATVNKWGTDEEEVYETLTLAQDFHDPLVQHQLDQYRLALKFPSQE